MPAKPTPSPAPRNPDAAGAKLWLAEEYGYITHDTVEPSKVGGDILAYLRSRGYEG